MSRSPSHTVPKFLLVLMLLLETAQTITSIASPRYINVIHFQLAPHSPLVLSAGVTKRGRSSVVRDDIVDHGEHRHSRRRGCHSLGADHGAGQGEKEAPEPEGAAAAAAEVGQVARRHEAREYLSAAEGLTKANNRKTISVKKSAEPPFKKRLMVGGGHEKNEKSKTKNRKRKIEKRKTKKGH